MTKKYIFIAKFDEKFEIQDIKGILFNDLVPNLLKLEPISLKIGLTEESLPRISIYPLKKLKIVMISISLEIESNQVITLIASNLEKNTIHGEFHGYLVEESIPVPRTVEKCKPGDKSSGIIFLTLFSRVKNLSDDTFMDLWFNVQTPKAIRIHRMEGYVRNRVTKMLTTTSKTLDGIVEEHYPEKQRVFNPIRMFGGVRKCLPHMMETYSHVKKFIDLKDIENYVLTEYYFI